MPTATTVRPSRNEALELAAVEHDWISDLNDGWIGCSGSQRLEYARSFVELCHHIETAGYGPSFAVGPPEKIGLRLCSMWVTILPKKIGYGTHYAIVQLEGARETSESDCMLMEFHESGRHAPDRRR